jgi:iron complex outermembrane receptor protein
MPGNEALSTPSHNQGRTDLEGAPNSDYNAYSRQSRNLDFHETEANEVGALITSTDIVGLTVTFTGDYYSITSVSSYYDADYYQKADTDGSPNDLLTITWSSNTIGYRQDLRFASEFDGMFNIIAGVYYGYEDQ